MLGKNNHPSNSTNPTNKKQKKSKKVRLLRNPFIEPIAHTHHEFNNGGWNNPFLDSNGLVLPREVTQDVEEGDDEDEQDEERTVQARREALAALDPKNKSASLQAEFRPLRAHIPIHEAATSPEQSPAQDRDPFSDDMQLSATAAAEASPVMTETPLSSTFVSHPRPHPMGHNRKPSTSSVRSHNRTSSVSTSGNSLLSTPKRVPDIAICQATPSPPPSIRSGRHHHRGLSSASIVQQNSTLLSTNYTPSPLSLWSDDADKDAGLSVSTKASSNRSTVIYKNTFQRVGSASTTFSSESLGSRTGDQGQDEGIPDHIGAQIGTRVSLTLLDTNEKRNTFGQRLYSSKWSGSQKKSKGDHGLLSNIDPWDFCDDMLGLHGFDDDSDDKVTGGRTGLLFGGNNENGPSPLKGKVGGRRRSSDDQTGEIVQRFGKLGRIGALASGAISMASHPSDVEDWIMHPRTAAIRGTFHKVHDVVPVPIKSPRPLSSSSDYTTISLASPPAHRYSNAFGGNLEQSDMTGGKGGSLSRTGSLDSFYRLKRGASSLLMGLGSVTLGDNQNKKQDTQVQTMMDGGAASLSPTLPRTAMTSQRSSSMTFGSRKSPSPPPPPPPPPSISTFPSLPSFHTLLTTGLSRSYTVPSSSSSGNISPPPFSPTAYLRRSQTTAATGRPMSFSPPISRRKNTPVMIPTIVVPEIVHNGEASPRPHSATMVTCSEGALDFAASSMTMISGGWGEDDGLQSGSPTFSLRSVSSRTFQRLVPVQQGDSHLRVPELASKNHTQTGSGTSLATAAMAAAQRARFQPVPSSSPSDLHRIASSGSDCSMTGPLSGDDFIGQFERERASARRAGFGSVAGSSSSTLASSLHQNSQTHGLRQTMERGLSFAKSASFFDSSNNSMISTGHDSQHADEDKSVKGSRRSFLRGLFGFFTGTSSSSAAASDQTARALAAHHHLRQRQDSGQSDISEKLMHLPEPSPFEGMCSCRGVVNISSMLLILSGLILLILGYPIAASIKKERMEAEAEAASMAKSLSSAASVQYSSAEAAAMGTPNATIANLKLNESTVLESKSIGSSTTGIEKVGPRPLIQVKFAMMDKYNHSTGFLFSKDFYNRTASP
ncbi:hypothetical protein EMPS_00168 [Entomortierella parvispora]|uniref:Uncharacterized protein n=1 Tax=Entomortierella parvispora TaxID=205924 RepID=A0A9P3LRL8_9FUNG|nr:hypothetical protein EMPS_00168 [Entomortierella parvispora]